MKSQRYAYNRVRSNIPASTTTTFQANFFYFSTIQLGIPQKEILPNCQETVFLIDSGAVLTMIIKHGQATSSDTEIQYLFTLLVKHAKHYSYRHDFSSFFRISVYLALAHWTSAYNPSATETVRRLNVYLVVHSSTVKSDIFKLLQQV